MKPTSLSELTDRLGLVRSPPGPYLRAREQGAVLIFGLNGSRVAVFMARSGS